MTPKKKAEPKDLPRDLMLRSHPEEPIYVELALEMGIDPAASMHHWEKSEPPDWDSFHVNIEELMRRGAEKEE